MHRLRDSIRGCNLEFDRNLTVEMTKLKVSFGANQTSRPAMNPVRNRDNERIMTDGWEVLSRAIPRGEAESVATLIGVATNTVVRWRREPEADDDGGTGRRSPLDAILLLINALYVRCPDGAELVADRINSEIAALRKKHGRVRQPTTEEMESALRQIGREVSEMADAIAERD